MHKLGLNLLLQFIFFQNSNPIVLRSCCDFQNSYINGKCASINQSNGQLETFPQKIIIGSGINSSNGFEFELRNKSYPFECTGRAVEVIIDSFKGKGILLSEEQLFPEGYLKLGRLTLPPNEFCVNSVSPTKHFMNIFACNQTCDVPNRCLPKCCPWGQVSRWLHSDLCYSLADERISNLIPKRRTHKTFTPFYHHKLNCIKQNKMIFTNSTNIFNVTQLDDILKSFIPGSYCFDDVIISHDMTFDWNNDQAIFHCGDEWPIEEFSLTPLERTVYGICFLLSFVFLMAAISIYYIKLHRTHSYVHTWIEFFYMISLMILGIFFCLHVYLPESSQDYCTAYYFTLVFGNVVFGVSLFSWASLLSFDLFIAFKELRPLGLEMAQKDVKRLVWYCIIGFSFPFLVAVSSFLYSYIYWKDAGFCIPLQLTFVRFVQGVLLLINTFFFVCTFYLIFKHRRKAKFATKRSTKELNQLVSCFVKLFIISGITYGGVIVGYIFGTERHTSWYLMAFRIFLNLRGVTIFFIYACNPQMKKLLTQRYNDGIFCGCICCKPDPAPNNIRMLSQRSTIRRTDVINL